MKTIAKPLESADGRHEENDFQEIAMVNRIRRDIVASFFLFLVAAWLIAGINISPGIIAILAFWTVISLFQLYKTNTAGRTVAKHNFSYLSGFFEIAMMLAIVYLSSDIHWISPIVLGFPVLYINFVIGRRRALAITILIAAAFTSIIIGEYLGIIPVSKLFDTRPVFSGDFRFTIISVLIIDLFLLFTAYAAGSFADLYRRRNADAIHKGDKLTHLNQQLIESEQTTLRLNESLESRITAKTKEISDRNLELEILNGIAVCLGKSLEINTILTDTLNRLVKIFPLSLCEIAVHDDIDANISYFVRAHTVVKVTRGSAACHISGKYGKDLRKAGQPLTVDIGTALTRPRLLTVDNNNGKDLLIFPINTKNRVIGSLAVTSAKNNFLANRDIGLLAAISNMIGSAIENGRLYEQLRNISDTDTSTGLFSQRFITRRLDSEFKRAARYGRSLSLMIIEMDFVVGIEDFNRVQDSRIFSRVSLALVSACRLTDIIGRYDDNRFLVILPETGRADGLRVEKRIHRGVSLLDLSADKNVNGPAAFAVNVGFATYPDNGDNLLDLISAVDKNINTVSFANDLIPSSKTLATEIEPDNFVDDSRFPLGA